MRTTVTLDGDVYSFIQAYAGGKSISISAALGELVRRTERLSEVDAFLGRLQKNEHGYLEIARTGHVLTPEMVRPQSKDDVA